MHSWTGSEQHDEYVRINDGVFRNFDLFGHASLCACVYIVAFYIFFGESKNIFVSVFAVKVNDCELALLQDAFVVFALYQFVKERVKGVRFAAASITTSALSSKALPIAMLSVHGSIA